MKVKNNTAKLNETERVLLNETIEWAGKFLTAYAHLKEAERNNDETTFDQAWGDLTTALFLLKDKAGQAYELLDKE